MAAAPPPPNRWNLPDLGLGLGLRDVHIDTILSERPDVGWLEVITENALHHEGWYRWVLDQLRERYPIALHGVSLSIGGADPLDMDYLKRVKALADHLQVPWLSDHVCWTGVRGRNSHDLLPVAYDEATLAWMIERIRVVQDVLERPLMLENPSSYAAFTCSTMTEWTFINRMAEEADCGLLLDVNNIYVSSVNHQFDPWDYLAAVPWDRVTQIHVAGHTNRVSHLFDSHIGPVIDQVWSLLEAALQRSGGRATMLEWDDEIPDFETVWAEAQKAAPLIAAAKRASPERPPAAQKGRRSGPRDDQRPSTGPIAHPAPAPVRDLQGWFFDAITGIASPTPAAVTDRVLPNPTMTAERRVSVYEDMVAARLQEAMEQDFPATILALGADAFTDAVTAYLRAHPSRHWALERLGADFPAWLPTHLPDAPPWLGACAQLEWQLVTTGWTPWQAPLAADTLAKVRPEQYADVRLHAAETTWLGEAPAAAVAAIGEAWESPVEGLAAALGQGQHLAANGPAAMVPVLIYRNGWSVDLRVPDAVEAALLRALLGDTSAADVESRAGAALGEAVERAAQTSPTAPDTIAAHLGTWTERWVAEHVITSLRV